MNDAEVRATILSKNGEHYFHGHIWFYNGGTGMSDLQLQFKNLLRKYGMLEDFEQMVEGEHNLKLSDFLDRTNHNDWVDMAFPWESHENGYVFWVIVERDWHKIVKPYELNKALDDKLAQIKSGSEQSKYHRTIKGVSVDRKHSHYFKDVDNLTEVDVYRVCDLFQVDDHSGCVHHAVKKLLLPGNRGSKDYRKDIQEAVDTLVRKLEMMDEDLIELEDE